MLGQNPHSAKKLQERSEHFGRNNSDRVIIEFCNFEVFAVDPENVVGALIYVRVVHQLIPGEEDIVGIERLAITPIHPVPQLESPGLLVRLNRPGFSQPRPGLLSQPVQIEQRRVQQTDDVIRNTVPRLKRVQRFWTERQSNGEAPSWLTRFSLRHQRRRRQRMSRRRWRLRSCGFAASDEQSENRSGRKNVKRSSSSI